MQSNYNNSASRQNAIMETILRSNAKVGGGHVENKRDPSNSLKRTQVESKGNNKTAILGRAVGNREMNRDRR